MSEIVTVTHDGKVYQIGQDYLFSVRGTTWVYEKLTDIDGGYSKPFCTKSKEWPYIKEVPASESMGTITPAPVELVDGSAYMFNVRIGKKYHAGIYDSKQHIFSISQGQWIDFESATNIRLMTVGSE
jgi:heterodisulfide reductase subunit A-like polyferredoxin